MKIKLQKTFGAMLALALAMTVALADAPPSQAHIQIKGMACPFCVQGVEKHLKKIPGVEGVTTSLQKGEAIVDIKGGKKVTEEQLRKAVKDAGFTAGEIRFENNAGKKSGEAPSAGGKK